MQNKNFFTKPICMESNKKIPFFFEMMKLPWVLIVYFMFNEFMLLSYVATVIPYTLARSLTPFKLYDNFKDKWNDTKHTVNVNKIKSFVRSRLCVCVSILLLKFVFEFNSDILNMFWWLLLNVYSDDAVMNICVWILRFGYSQRHNTTKKIHTQRIICTQHAHTHNVHGKIAKKDPKNKSK